MTPTYSDHIDRAHLAAALAVTMPPPPALDAARQLHDGVITVLGEATRLICLSSLGEPRAERERAGIPAAQELAAQLAAYPRLGLAANASSPSERWSTRPQELTAEIPALDAWKILAAEAFLARACLDPMERRLTTPLRGAVLTDLAALAEAVATATAELGPAAGAPAPDHILAKARALAAAADRVHRDAAAAVAGTDRVAMPLVSAAPERRQVQLVRGHSDIAAALGNLARLTSTGPPHAPEMFATTIMLATVAESVAAALEAGQARPGSPNRADRHATAALAEYRHQLTRVIRKHQPKLASLGPGNAAALAQARELRTAGVPRLEALASDSALARTATGDLRRIAAALAPATAAVRTAFAALEERGGLLAYDWAPGPGFHWRTATTVDALPLLHGFEAAIGTVRALRPGRSALLPAATPPPRRQRATTGHIVDLTEAIDRRRADLARQAHVPDGSPAAPSPVQASRMVSTPTRDRATAGPIMR